MFLLHGVFSGIIATLIFDTFQIALLFAYKIDKSKWFLVGRYFLGVINKNFIRNNIENDTPLENELLIGYLCHYIIGSIFGIIYVTINILFFSTPSIFLALTIGFITVLGSWCIMMPFAFNFGFFASKTENRKQLMTQNLIAHFIFGIGLFIGYSIFFY